VGVASRNRTVSRLYRSSGKVRLVAKKTRRDARNPMTSCPAVFLPLSETPRCQSSKRRLETTSCCGERVVVQPINRSSLLTSASIAHHITYYPPALHAFHHIMTGVCQIYPYCRSSSRDIRTQSVAIASISRKSDQFFATMLRRRAGRPASLPLPKSTTMTK
jgi:hypothetical protein